MTQCKTRCEGWLCFVYYLSSANAANTIVCKTAMTGSCSVWFQVGFIWVEFFAQICWLLGGFGSIYLPLMKNCRLVYFSISQTFYWIWCQRYRIPMPTPIPRNPRSFASDSESLACDFDSTVVITITPWIQWCFGNVTGHRLIQLLWSVLSDFVFFCFSIYHLTSGVSLFLGVLMSGGSVAGWVPLSLGENFVTQGL